MEPEVALLSISPEFNNSMEMIAWISKSVPADVLLVIKEQPLSFGIRSRHYYDNFRRIENVVLADPRVHSWEWIRAASVVATITGSVGFEAVHFERPTVTLSLDKQEVYAGETVNATASASDPHNDPLTLSWSVDNQSRPGTASQLAVNTSGMSGGSHSVTVTVRDDRDGRATDTKSFSVTEKIVIQINQLRPDNIAKAQLDEIALKMQQSPQLRATITGHTDDRGGESGNERYGQRRADAVKDYLVEENNISEGRIETKSAGESQPMADNSTAQGRQENRRVEVELSVP